MTNLVEFLSYPFVQRALIGGIAVAVVAGLMGVFTTMRQASFFGDAIAHSSLAGVALGLLLGVNPLLAAFVYAVGVALILPRLRTKTGFSFDNLLGIFLPMSMGLGVVLFASLPGYQPELLGFLFGSVLAMSWVDVLLLLVLAIIIIIGLHLWWLKLTLVSIDPDYAQMVGLSTRVYETIYHILLALTIVAGVRLVGIVLMNALLIIPASIVKLYARSFKSLLLFTPLIGVICVTTGLVFSVQTNAPSGAMIAVVSGGFFGLAVIFQKLWFLITGYLPASTKEAK